MKSKLCSSILLLLLCLGAFHFNQVQAATCDSSKTNCKTCDGTTSSDNCLTCNDNYYVDSNACRTCADPAKYLPAGQTTASGCTTCVANCKECNVDGTCKTCNTNYILSTDKKTCGTCPDQDKYFPSTGTTATDCTACTANCKVCNVDGTCKTCIDYYALAGNAKTCSLCSDTSTYLPLGKTAASDCTSCGAGCKTCSLDGKCTTCNPNYYLDSDKCNTCSDTSKYLPTAGTKATDCVSCVTNCKECNVDGTCKTCANNYYLATDKKSCNSCSASNKYVPIGKTKDTDCVECALGCTTCNIDGTCATCADGRYVKNGKCTTCPTGCTKCGTEGKCTSCSAGFFLSSDSCKACGTGCTACGTDGKCTTCTTGYVKNAEGSCTACSSNCNVCGTDGKCTTCAAKFYVSSDACKSCGTGCTACGTDGKCTTCDTGYVKNAEGSCTACSSNCNKCGTDGKCTECAATYYLSSDACKTCGTGCTTCGTDGKCTACDNNYYFANDACTACPASTYANVAAVGKSGKQVSTDCKACDVKFYYSTTNKVCTACEDANCWTCSGAGLGKCLTCPTDYTLASGTCVEPGTATKRTGSVSANIRFDMDMDTYTLAGGANYFVASVAKALTMPASQIEVIGTEKGSVIVLFRIFSTGTITPADVSLAINSAIAQGTMSSIYTGKIIMDSNAVVLLSNGCPSGQYYDAANYVCLDCTEDKCPSDKKSKVGPILGGVLGGAAFILIAVVLIAKKTSWFDKSKKAPKSAGAQYNLAVSSPTSPSAENERV